MQNVHVLKKEGVTKTQTPKIQADLHLGSHQSMILASCRQFSTHRGSRQRKHTPQYPQFIPYCHAPLVVKTSSIDHAVDFWAWHVVNVYKESTNLKVLTFLNPKVFIALAPALHPNNYWWPTCCELQFSPEKLYSKHYSVVFLALATLRA